MAGNQGGGARRILVAVVGAPHGVKGELRIKSYMQVPTAIGNRVVFAGAEGGRALAVEGVRPVKDDMVVARIAGVTSREAAAALTGTALYIDRGSLQPPAEDEFYNADLIGLPVRTTAGVEVGPVVDVVDYGGGDLLEVATAEGATILVPFLKRFVPVVDLAAGHLLVTPEALTPEGGDAGPGDVAS